MDMAHPLLRDSDTSFTRFPIHGGMAVWQEDLSQLNRLRREIRLCRPVWRRPTPLLREEGRCEKAPAGCGDKPRHV